MKFNDFINTGLLRDLVNKRRFSMKRVITRPGGACMCISNRGEQRQCERRSGKKREREKMHTHTDKTGKRLGPVYCL